MLDEIAKALASRTVQARIWFAQQEAKRDKNPPMDSAELAKNNSRSPRMSPCFARMTMGPTANVSNASSRAPLLSLTARR
jgi:hypothetical protein